MSIPATDEPFAKASALFRERQYAESLAVLDAMGQVLHNSAPLMLLRAQNLLGLHRLDEAQRACDAALKRLLQIESDTAALADFMSESERKQVAETVHRQRVELEHLRKTVELRLADASDKAELQETVAALQAELDALKSKAANAAGSQEHLAEEIEALRAKEAEKEEALRRAEHQMQALQRALAEREAAIQKANAESAESEQRVRALEEELVSLHERASNAADSEDALNAELQELRSLESTRKQALEAARGQLEQLQGALAERERAIAEAKQLNAEREQAMADLRQQMDTVRTEAESASTSEQALHAELEQLRVNERSKSEALEQARREMESLRGALEEREGAVAEAQRQREESEKAVLALRGELDGIRQQAARASSSEEALAKEIAALRANESEKTSALTETRSALDGMRDELVRREQELENARRERSMSGDSLNKLQEELASLQQRAQHASDSERALMSEIEQLRNNESGKSRELESTRGELEQLRAQLGEREQAMQTAEQANIEHAAQMAALQGELENLRHRAEHASNSEESLTREVEQLRSSEAAKNQALEDARNEVETLRKQLESRQQEVEQASASNSAHEAMMARLNEELRHLQTQASTASESEVKLEREIAQLRENEEAKSRELTQAQAQMQALKQELEERQQAAEQATRQSTESAATINALQQELDGLRSEASDATNSQSALGIELNSLREAQQMKEVELGDARREVEKLKQTLAGRDKKVAHQEYLLTRAREKGPRSAVLPLLIAAVAVLAGVVAYLQWQSYATRQMEREQRVFTLRFPEREPIGTVYTRPGMDDRTAQWNKFGPARGNLEFVGGTAIGLRLAGVEGDNLAPLSPLAGMEEIRALWLEDLTVNDANMQILASLRKLEEISVENGLTEEHQAAVRAALPKDCLLITDLPLAIARQELFAPPEARILRFPDDRSLGVLFTRKWTAQPLGQWNRLGAAQGAVAIPAEQAVRLVVDSAAATDLSPLARLEPDALHTIELVGKEANDEAMLHVGRLTGLRGINLSYTGVTNAGLMQLASLRFLTQVTLLDIDMNREGFMVFDPANFPFLEYLSIERAKIDNASLARFKSLAGSLDSLHIANTGVTQEGMLELKRSMPDTQITP
jgi:predicted  nucleic acid-binding Zn-ribbon protein